MTILKIENLSFYYNNSMMPILDNCSINLTSGSAIALVGLNGSGKSTFLKLIAGILKVNTGTIYYGNRPIRNIKSSKDFVALLPENAKLFLVGTSVFNEFMSYYDSKDEIINELSKFHLETLLEKKIYELSEGQRRLIAILSLFKQKKEIFLLDEPTIGLDTFGRKILSDLLQVIKKEGKIVIVATNDNRILTEVDQIIGLKDGKFIIDGPPQEELLHLEEKLSIFPNQISRLTTNLKKKNNLIPNMIKSQELNNYLKSMEK